MTRTVGLMVLALVALVLAAILSSCAPLGMRGEPIALDGAGEAVRIVWRDVYRQRTPAPKVRWVTGAALDCDQPSGVSGFRTVIGCRGGFALSPLEVSVAIHDDEPISATPLAHELLHAAQLRAGVVDPSHQGPGWRQLGDCIAEGRGEECGVVERANEALAARGL